MNQSEIGVLQGCAPRNGHEKAAGLEENGVHVTARRNPGLNESDEGTGNDETVAPSAATVKLPDESWGLTDLARFVTLTVRRSGVDAWWIGKALLIARTKHTKKRHWLRWLKTDVKGLGQSTAYRYMDVCSAFGLDEVEGKTLSVLYKLMQINEDDDAKEPVNEEKDEAPDDIESQQPIVARKNRKKAVVTGGEHTDDGPENDPKPPEPQPQPPVTAAEIDSLAVFIEAVGGLTRATFVFRDGVEQLKELANAT